MPEAMPLLPLMPSLLVEEEAPRSPLAMKQDFRFQRGTLIHKLLEFLPSLPMDAREEAANSFLRRYGSNFHPAAQGEIRKQVLSLLRHPAFAPVFSLHSRAEVPLAGMVAGSSGEMRHISGQIDRLLVGESEVLAVDYKTTRQPPETLEAVPALYIRQMAAYYALLAGIYPEKTIRCALVWTAVPMLMDLPVEMLLLA